MYENIFDYYQAIALLLQPHELIHCINVSMIPSINAAFPTGFYRLHVLVTDRDQ